MWAAIIVLVQFSFCIINVCLTASFHLLNTNYLTSCIYILPNDSLSFPKKKKGVQWCSSPKTSLHFSQKLSSLRKIFYPHACSLPHLYESHKIQIQILEQVAIPFSILLLSYKIYSPVFLSLVSTLTPFASLLLISIPLFFTIKKKDKESVLGLSFITQFYLCLWLSVTKISGVCFWFAAIDVLRIGGSGKGLSPISGVSPHRETWDLLQAAAGEVERMRLNEEEEVAFAFGSLHRKPSPTGFYTQQQQQQPFLSHHPSPIATDSTSKNNKTKKKKVNCSNFCSWLLLIFVSIIIFYFSFGCWGYNNGWRSNNSRVQCGVVVVLLHIRICRLITTKRSPTDVGIWTPSFQNVIIN